MRSLLSRLTKQSDEQRSKMATQGSERDALLRCIANYRFLITAPWSTVAACTPNTTTAAVFSYSPSAQSCQPSTSAASTTASSPSMASIPSAGIDDSTPATFIAAVPATECSAAPATVSPLPSPLDDAVDVDECRPLLRVTLSDCTHWLLMTARRDTPLRTAATIIARQHKQDKQDGDSQLQDETEEEEGEDDNHSTRPSSLFAWDHPSSHTASSISAVIHAGSVAAPVSASSSSVSPSHSLGSDLASVSSARCLFWSELSVYLSYKWRKYQLAARNTPNYTPFALLQPPASPSSSTASAVDTSAPNPSWPLSSFVGLLSSSASLSCSLSLFDGTTVPADCLSILSSSLSSHHSSVVSRVRAVHHQRVSDLLSSARLAEQSHESVVRDFSRYQQRTRELLAQKQRQLDELSGREEETDGLRSSLTAMSSQLESVNRDKSSQAASILSLAQQLQACQADKERSLISERNTHTALQSMQTEMNRIKETEEAKLAMEQQRAQQAEDAVKRLVRQMEEISRQADITAAAEPNTLPQATSVLTTAPASLQPAAAPYGLADSATADGASDVSQQHEVPILPSTADSIAWPAVQQSTLTVTVPDSPNLSFLNAADSHTVDESSAADMSSAELATLRARVRSLQSLIQQREIALVQLQSALDVSSSRCRALESDLALLRSMESGSSNVEYLRNVLCRFLSTDDDTLIPVLCTLLNVDKQQQSGIVNERAKHSRSHGRAVRQTSAAGATAATQPPSFFAFF